MRLRSQQGKMNQHRSHRAPKSNKKQSITIGLGLAMALGLVGCASEPAPFDPLFLQQTQRNLAKENRTIRQTLPPIPTTMQATFQTTTDAQGRTTVTRTTGLATTGPSVGDFGEQYVRLTLQEVIQRAVMNNREAKVAGYAPAIEAARTVEAEARFDPTIFSNVQAEFRDSAIPPSVFTGSNGFIDFDQQNIYTFSSGIRQNLPTGAQAELRYQATYTDADPARNFSDNLGNQPFDPYWENELVLQLTQPLLRDFGIEVNRARITISRNNQRISLLDFRQTLEESLANLEQRYWQLVQAEQNVQIIERLLSETEYTAEVLAKRTGQDVTRQQTSEANSRVEIRRSLLISAKARVRDLSDQIKQLMNDPQIPVTSPVVVLPASEPALVPIEFDLQDQIDTAMQNRLELSQQQLRVDSASITNRVGKNNLLPQLNLIGQVGVNAVSDGTLLNTADDQLDLDYISYTVGLQFEIPIGNRAARAIYKRTLLQRQQSVEQYKLLVDQVALDVKQTTREVDTAWRRVVADRQSKFAAADALLALRQRADADEPLTPDFVSRLLDAQANLANQEQTEVQSITDYNIGIARLERAKGTLLRYNNVLMEESQVQPFNLR